MMAPVAIRESIYRMSARMALFSCSLVFKSGCVTHHGYTFSAIFEAIAFAEDDIIPNSAHATVQQNKSIVSRNFASPKPSVVDLMPTVDFVLDIVEQLEVAILPGVIGCPRDDICKLCLSSYRQLSSLKINYPLMHLNG